METGDDTFFSEVPVSSFNDVNDENYLRFATMYNVLKLNQERQFNSKIRN